MSESRSIQPVTSTENLVPSMAGKLHNSPSVLKLQVATVRHCWAGLQDSDSISQLNWAETGGQSESVYPNISRHWKINQNRFKRRRTGLWSLVRWSAAM